MALLILRVHMTCMGWQKRGRAFNSSTGHGAAMSLNSIMFHETQKESTSGQL